MKRISDIDALKNAERAAKRAARRVGPLGSITVGIIFFVIMQVIYAVVSIVDLNKDTHKIKFDPDLETVVYSEESNVSSFDLDLGITHRDYYVLTATDVSYKLTFKDKSGNVLHEQVVAMTDALTEYKTDIKLTFGDGELDAVTGKVDSVDAEIVNATFVNKIEAKGGSTGFKYLFENWMLLIGILVSLAFFIFAMLIGRLDGCLSDILFMVFLAVGLIAITLTTPNIVVALAA